MSEDTPMAVPQYPGLLAFFREYCAVDFLPQVVAKPIDDEKSALAGRR
jgi:hypothetical protein